MEIIPLKNLKLLKYLLLFLAFTSLNCIVKEQSEIRIKSNFNAGWKFHKEVLASELSIPRSDYDDSSWQTVNLPHTANLEALVMKEKQWQGQCWYRKSFRLSSNYQNKHLALYFEGAMQTAEIWLNGKLIDQHKGGYLPFYIEISKHVFFGKENVISIKLNNEDQEKVPPGKPISDLDFNYYSGLYRNVHLIVKDKIHITDPIQKDLVSGGGIFVETLSANAEQAKLRIRTDLFNTLEDDVFLKVQNSVYDAAGILIDSFTSSQRIVNGQKTGTFIRGITLNNPDLWSPETPNLYTAKVALFLGNRLMDIDSVRFGIRSIKFDAEGFYLNHQKYNLRGTNRHQEYPFVGNAISDNAQYRDAYKIKEAGFNFVRLSHYPHSESFMNACDELGLLVMDAIPGWQYFGDSTFQKNSYHDIRQLIRRDRNHPSVILWEASLNESPMSQNFMDNSHKIVHEELTGKEVYSCGWMDYAYDVFIPARQHSQAPDYWKKYNRDKAILIAEYGDWEYYAQNAGFNQTAFKNLKKENRSSRQLRRYGQIRMAQQALNYQEAHNDNLYNTSAGDANWLMFDYNRGYAPDIESSGIMDIFRLPKFAYYFYRSQKDLSTKDTVLFIANYWNDPTYNAVKIYSNCAEVELWLNDEFIERRRPDTDRNSTNLAHPPFTFKNINYQNGKLTAKGYIDGKMVKEKVRISPGQAYKIELKIDESDTELQLNDIVFVYAKLLDKDGNYVPISNNKVSFTIEGDAELIGDNPAISEAGIASVLLKTTYNSQKIKISASAENLIGNYIEINLTGNN